MPILGIIYGSAALLVLLLTIVMEFRHRREKHAAILMATLLVAATAITQVFHPMPSAEDVSLFVVMDFTVAVTALMLFLNRPLPWCLTLVALSLSMLGLDLFWPMYVEGSWQFKNAWAWVSNSLYVGQLCCILYAAVEFPIRRQYIKYQRRKNPLYGTIWCDRGMRLRDEKKDRF